MNCRLGSNETKRAQKLEAYLGPGPFLLSQICGGVAQWLWQVSQMSSFAGSDCLNYSNSSSLFNPIILIILLVLIVRIIVLIILIALITPAPHRGFRSPYDRRTTDCFCKKLVLSWRAQIGSPALFKWMFLSSRPSKFLKGCALLMSTVHFRFLTHYIHPPLS